MSSSIILHLDEVLDNKRLMMLPSLSLFREKGFYLAGGTALAFFFGHRESEDFDFFTDGDFDPKILFDFCENHFIGKSVEKVLEADNTLWITVDEVKFSFFVLKSPLIESLIHTEHLDLASIRDIGAMKMAAIQQRATRKDYIDIALIIEKLGIHDLLSCFSQKYGNIISEPLLLKALIYFEDIVNADVIMKSDQRTWEEVKKYLEEEVKKYMKQNYIAMPKYPNSTKS